MSNKQLAYNFAQSLTERDLEQYARLLHADYVNHNAFAAPGKAGSVAVFTDFLKAFPDFTVTVEAVFEDGEALIGRFKYTGTFTHSLMGYAPTGKRVEMRSIDIWYVRDGLLAEHWDELNTLELFVQIGGASLTAPNVLSGAAS
jgi:predicted SnoaL-like aldol condensation-catalyzing enzyme